MIFIIITHFSKCSEIIIDMQYHEIKAFLTKYNATSIILKLLNALLNNRKWMVMILGVKLNIRCRNSPTNVLKNLPKNI